VDECKPLPAVLHQVPAAAAQGLVRIARHVRGCYVTQHSRVRNACRRRDAAGKAWQALLVLATA